MDYVTSAAIKEIRNKRRQLEVNILTLIEKYEEETSVHVSNVEIYEREITTTSDERPIFVKKLSVKIEL